MFTFVPLLHLIPFPFEDINECERHNGLCEHNCHNTDGSYYCKCNRGYALSVNNHSCAGMFHMFLV